MEGRVPLVVGVVATPALTADDLEALAPALEAAVAGLRAEHPHAPLAFLSAWRPGAEAGLRGRLAAHGACLTSRAADETALAEDLARHAHVLLALGDEERDAGVGAAVRAITEGRVARRGTRASLLDPADRGPAGLVRAPGGTTWRPPTSTGDEVPGARHARMRALLDRFDADAAGLAREDAAALERSAAWLEGGEAGFASTAPWRGRFAAADALAIALKGRRTRLLRALVVLALVTGLSFSVYADLYPHPALLWTHAATLLVALVLWGVALRRGDVETRFLDARALAEGWRVQVFWRLAGVDEPVADHYLGEQAEALDWIRTALRTAPLLLAAEGAPAPPPHPEGARLVLRRWIEDQGGWYARRATLQRRVASRLAGTSTGFVLLGGLLTGVLTVLATGSALAGRAVADAPWRDPLLFSVAASFTTAAVVFGYAQVLALREQSVRYAAMAARFAAARAEAEEILAAEPDPDAAHRFRDLVLTLGREVLQENADWLHLHRERPASPRLGG